MEKYTTQTSSETPKLAPAAGSVEERLTDQEIVDIQRRAREISGAADRAMEVDSRGVVMLPGEVAEARDPDSSREPVGTR